MPTPDQTDPPESADPARTRRAAARVVPLRAVRRDEHSVLVRLPAAGALVVDELAEQTADLLSRLGASSTAHLVGLAGRSDAGSAAVLDKLARVAERSAPRASTRALVEGDDPIARSLQVLVSGDDPVPRDPSCADLVLPVTAEALDLDACRAHAAAGRTVLPVIVRGDHTVIGPLLTPDGGPCARCLELHRCDRDPHRARWLTALAPHLRELPIAQLDPVLAALTVAVTAALARAHLRGLTVPPALSVSIRLPWPDLRHHEWRAHPRCGCWTMEA